MTLAEEDFCDGGEEIILLLSLEISGALKGPWQTQGPVRSREQAICYDFAMIGRQLDDY